MPSHRLIPLHELLMRELPRIALLRHITVPLAEAAGLASASALCADQAMPAQSVALRAGLAIAAEDTLGATAHEPAFLAVPPHAVLPGEAIPAGTNAVIDPANINRVTNEVFLTVSPGEGVRFAGHDLAVGRVIIAAGQRFNDAHLAMLAATGIERVAVRAPSITFHGFEPWVERLLKRLAIAAGCCVDDGSTADLTIETAAIAEPVLAIAPGSFTELVVIDGAPVLRLSPRFDSALTGFLMVGLPIILHLSGAQQSSEILALAADIRNRSGFSTLALLRRGEGGLLPCMIGEITLDALLDATHFAVLPPESEGVPAGAALEVTALDLPLIRSSLALAHRGA